jgi:hypothetical protein
MVSAARWPEDGDGRRRGTEPGVFEGAATPAGAARRSLQVTLTPTPTWSREFFFASFRSIQTKSASPLQPFPAERAQGGPGVVRADPVPAGTGALVLRGQLRRAQPQPQVPILQGLHFPQ